MGDSQESSGATCSGSSKKKHEDKHRKKDPKSWENILKATATMDKESERTYIGEKYQELYNTVRKLTSTNQQLMKQNATLQKENDHSQSELTKGVVTRARLESICRELQKQNKQIREENIAKIKEEEERRKEVSLKFADKLSDINNMMDENKEKSNKLREENLKMTTKLAELYNQFQEREEDISKMSHQLELERNYSQATIEKMDLEMRAQQEVHLQEQAVWKRNLEKSEANCCVLLERVKALQNHIDVYKNQCENLESTMTKSTKVFDNFKTEIGSMTKKVAILEQEVQSWKRKFTDSMAALIEMSDEKKNQDMYVQSLDKKNEQLNKLCRQLQVDRSNYLKLLKSHGIEPISNPEKSPTEVSPKMTKKEKELHLLKENLKAVQNELTKLSVEEIGKTEPNKNVGETTQEARCTSGNPAEGHLLGQVTPGTSSNTTPITYLNEADFEDVPLTNPLEESEQTENAEEEK